MARWILIGLLLLFALSGALCVAAFLFGPAMLARMEGVETYTIEISDHRAPPAPAEEEALIDDKLSDKHPPAFDPLLVDPRPLENGWLLNASAAVIGLDTPLIKPDLEPELLQLHPSYAKAIGERSDVLPSVNLLDGKAKQFDDGLYAALDQAYYQGLEGKLLSHVALVRRLYDAAGADSPAAAYLAAGLQLAGEPIEAADLAAQQSWLRKFRADPTLSKPIGFYTWNETLSSCFQFLRFFQQPFDENELDIPLALSKTLANDHSLLADYRQAVDFYSRLTNPYELLSIADLAEAKVVDSDQFAALCREKQPRHAAVALFPASTSRETELFKKLFPRSLPPQADLMRELVRRIRSGEVDLKPRADSGWYDYQVHALETMLLPEQGAEHDKLLLSKAYKKRMLEAFQALVTKRRETHSRNLAKAASAEAMPPSEIRPRLRVEPCPSYYLRTGRAYAFLADFLQASLGDEVLEKLHGLRQDGERSQTLAQELPWMRDLFYGLYLVSAEDIGLKADFAADEPLADEAQQARCHELALAWLGEAFTDADLAADTRVGVPIYVDRERSATRLWATLGVRLTRLDAGYAIPPRIKQNDEGDWQEPDSWLLAESSYLIPVDEFAEVELPGLKALSREELRAICDREKTKDAIVRALQE